VVKPYPEHEWIDPRIAIRESGIAGLGMFARAPIRAGEMVIVWGGWECTREDVTAGRVAPRSTVYIGEDRFLGARVGEYNRERDDRGDFINHACDSNVWLGDENTLVARRDIVAGEELTIDYALFEGDEAEVKPWDCRCGSPLCRRQVTGADWHLPALQERYRGHFSPFINRRIERLAGVQPPARHAGSHKGSGRDSREAGRCT
jgi:hypothetical protein